ncbi:MAG: hypothetical protein QG597_400 [Actinomycetota bacterium]|nr:hypothetical protein [Actinomycetota bacterium]
MSDDQAAADPTAGDWLLPHLADLPAPAMPADISDHLLAVIRAESVQRQHATAAAAPSAPVTDLEAERRARRSSRRWWAAAAGVAAIGLAGLVYVETMPSTPDAGSVAAGSASGPTDTAAAVVPITSGADYSVQNLTTMVPATISSSRATLPSRAPTDALRTTFAATEAGIRSCLAGVGNPPQDLALLDLARFQNAPVAVLAYLDGNDDGTADVVVVGVRCSQEDPQVRHRDVANMISGGATQPE